MQKRLECTISGRVQMVMYRDFTVRNARALKLVGTVKNNADGTVAVVAEGEEAALTQFLQKLHQGPVLAHVEGVEEAWTEPTNTFQDFSIVYK